MTEKIGPDDVLCGRGGGTNNHVGNIRFRELVAEHQSRYLLARKKEKSLIAREIVSKVHEKGGRFLKRNAQTDVWEEVTMKKATEKSSQALREGLDVRHNTVRLVRKGQKHRSSSHNKSNNIDDEEKINEDVVKRRARIVTGNVSTSPAVVSVGGEVGNIPDLNHDEVAPTSHVETRFVYQPIITHADCNDICEI